MKLTSKWKGMLPLVLGMAFIGQTFAQDLEDLEFEDEGEVLSSEQMDIDGTFRTRPKPTAADRMNKMRRKLEERNENMVRKKIEDARVKQEKKLAGQLRNAFNGNGLGEDSQDEAPAKVETVVAAPEVVVAPAPAPVVEEKAFEEFKIIPKLGMLAVQGQDVDFQSNLNAGLGFETKVSPRFAIGLSMSYSTLEIEQYTGQSTGSNPYAQQYAQPVLAVNPYYYNVNAYPYSPYQNNISGFNSFNGWYQNQFGNQGRTVEYTHYNFEVYGKFYLLVDRKFLPYLGMGAGYNQANLSYTEDGAFTDPFNVSFGEESYDSSYLSGSFLVGSDLMFTKTVGLNLEFKYQKGFGDNLSSESQTGFKNFDQMLLEDLGQDIESANFLSVTGGIVVSF